MKTLFVLRHAKSSWENTDLSDFERPLNKRGLETAPMMGEIIKENKFQPELILSSPARRAEQTARLVKDAARINGEIKFDDRIYEASPSRLLEVISEQDEKIKSVMLVGHNPGLEALIKIITNEIQPMPTAALAVIDLKIESWKEITSSTGDLRTLIRPKEVDNGR